MPAPSKFVCTGPTLRAMPVLTLSHVHKAFGPQIVLDDVSLTVRRGARLGLIGRNGEGKSTLLKLIAGQVEADAGELTLRSGDPADAEGSESSLEFAYVVRSAKGPEQQRGTERVIGLGGRVLHI